MTAVVGRGAGVASLDRVGKTAIGDVSIEPPQPSCSYFALKLSSVGIQTSKLIIESFVGVVVPATRQNCGKPVFVVESALPVAHPGGVLNVPPEIV